MEFGIAAEDQAFREEVRRFFEKEKSDELMREVDSGLGWGPQSREFFRKLGARGWLTPGWPKEYGGLGASFMAQFILVEEMDYLFRAPARPIAASIVGPTILLYGSEEQKQEFLLPIARGEVEFCLGYTEPEAGSDLASLRMWARDDGDSYVLNGQKIFNTGCHYADYHWLAVRTNLEAPKHRGISLFIVDLKSPGITVRPLWPMDGGRTNEVFYDNVRVPKGNLVGEVDRGFFYMARALDLERVFTVEELRLNFLDLVEYVRQARRSGQAFDSGPSIWQSLAQIATELEVGRLLSYRVAWMINNGVVPNYETAILKVHSTEIMRHLASATIRILGPYAQLDEGSAEARLGGRAWRLLANAVRRNISAGTSEIQRNVIAIRGLGLPRT